LQPRATPWERNGHNRKNSERVREFSEFCNLAATLSEAVGKNDLCASVVNDFQSNFTTETQRPFTEAPRNPFSRQTLSGLRRAFDRWRLMNAFGVLVNIAKRLWITQDDPALLTGEGDPKIGTKESL